MKVDGPLTWERLNEIAEYDDLFGEFFAKIRRGKVLKGEVLGSIRSDWYIVIGIDGHQYLAHRLVVFYLTGEWPQDDVDHRNGDTSCNAPWNLRVATRSQNLANSKKSRANTSGFKGVAWHRRAGKWRAEISLHGTRTYLGLYETPEAAHAAYAEAAQRHHGNFARTA